MVRTTTSLLAAALLGLAAACTRAETGKPRGGPSRPPAPVEAAPLRVGSLVERRTFSGTLEATLEFTVAPKVGGRLEAVHVDLGDVVEAGDIVATIDDAELVQVVAQAEAEVAVARANQGEAESAHLLAERALRRTESLSQQGITSEAELDNARVNEAARRSRLDVTAAQVARAEATLAAARIQLSYADVTALWASDSAAPEVGAGSDVAPVDRRVVGRRFVDAGGFVTAGTPLMSIVDLDPIVAVITVPERDYAHLTPGLAARITTDAYPGQSFVGVIDRLAPVFNRSTRQVRVELVVANPDLRLKPGMFVRAALDLAEVRDTAIAPFAALAERGGRTGMFVLDASGAAVAWRPVELGVREGDDVEVLGEGLAALAAAGRGVVVLGQELCDDGAPVRVVAAGDVSPGEEAR